LMVLMLGPEPATMNFWLRDEKVNSRVLAVRNGRALGILSRSVRLKPVCSPSLSDGGSNAADEARVAVFG